MGVVVLKPQILLGLLGVQLPVVLHGPLLMGLPDGLGSAEGAQLPPALLSSGGLCPLAVHARKFSTRPLNSCKV